MRQVLITGASSGIGLQLAKDYNRQGWQVTGCGRSLEKLEEAFKGTDIKPLAFDLLKREQVKESINSIAPPDLAILNAGNCEYIDDATQFDAELFERVIQTNLIGTGNTLAAVLPRMKRGSRVALVGSSVSLLPLTRAEAYGASKAGIDYLARTLAIDLKSEGIDVSLIRPGFVDTPLTQQNDFPMLMLISVALATDYIVKGLEKGKFNIDFPTRFIVLLKILGLLPWSLWWRLGAKMKSKPSE